MDQQTTKQQVVDRIKQAENILVTVSVNPSVDQLAACIGLTLLINKMGRSATAVYSGKTPPVMEFLKPQDTLETNTDSLRDFIISLDKSKADKLRYKVEDEVVRIFITPYKTSLSEKDLVFSEGDFNVDVVVALGVLDRAQVDLAIAAHGRILHDATVIALSAGPGKAPDLGQINWQDPSASSLSEMLVSVSEAFGTGLIDGQIATAFLTGIVAATDRFSNKKTSPKVMTMSAQLMAAGANQQLVISKLQPPPPPAPSSPLHQVKSSAPLPLPPKPEAPKSSDKQPKPQNNDEGLMTVAHEPTEYDGNEIEINTKEIRIDKQGNLQTVDENKKNPDIQQPHSKTNELAEEKKLAPPQPPPPPPPPLPTKPEAELSPFPAPPPIPAIKLDDHNSSNDLGPLAPSKFQPIEPSEDGINNRHALIDPLSRPPEFGTSFSADTSSSSENGGFSDTPIDPVNSQNGASGNDFSSLSKKVVPLSSLPVSQQGGLNPDSARQAVESAFGSAPFNPADSPTAALGSEPGPDLHHAPEGTPQNDTPSLVLPGNNQNLPKPAAPDSPPLPPAPPPLPPPILPGFSYDNDGKGIPPPNLQ